MELEEQAQECTICKCGMSVPSFDPSLPEGPSEDCFRLPCKHAFHAGCLVQSLRSSSNMCPVCRDTGGGPAGPEPLMLESESEEEEEANFADQVLQSLESSNPRVLAAKRSLMSNVKAYNLMRDRLRQDRRRAIASAMHEFRRRHLREFYIAKQRVADALDLYHSRVRSELHVNPEDMQFPNVQDVLRQQGGFMHSVRRQDPMRLSFWH